MLLENRNQQRLASRQFGAMLRPVPYQELHTRSSKIVLTNSVKEQSEEKPARMVRPFADVKLQFCFSGLSLSESRGPPSQRRRVYVPSNFPQDATSVQLRFLFYPSLSSPFLFTFQPLNHHFANFSYESWKNSSYELRSGFANNDEEESFDANA